MRISMYDPEKEKILRMIKQGKTYKAIMQELDIPECAYQGFYGYCRKLGVKAEKGRVDVPRCEECAELLNYETTCGNKGRVCLAARKGIAAQIETSPAWCIYRD